MGDAGRGRPRSEAADRAIRDATLALLAEGGYAALSIEAVASRAGVTRPTVYRRHTTRAELVLDAVRDAFERMNPDVPDTGSAVEDVRQLLANLIATLRDTPLGDVMRALVPELPRDPELRRVSRRFERARRALLRSALERGVDRGELDASLAVEIAIDALLGAIYLRLFLTGDPLSSRLAKELSEALLPT